MSHTARLPFFSLAPNSLKAMINLSKSVSQSAIGERIFELVNLRVSQINGCGVCVDMHWRFLLKQGAEPRHHRHQPRFAGVDLRFVIGVPAQPGVLQHILGIGAHAQHAIGDRKQPWAQRRKEGQVVGVGVLAHGDGLVSQYYIDRRVFRNLAPALPGSGCAATG